MTDNEEYNSPSLKEGIRLHLEATDTSFINATLLESSISGELDSSLVNNNAAASSKNTISAAMLKPLPDERKIITPKKRRKKEKETSKNVNLIGVSADDLSFTESAKTSTNGILTGLTNSPSPSQAKISDDFTTCSFLINLDGSVLPPENENDNTEGQNESFGAENLSCSMLSCNIDNEIGNISSKIQDFQQIILEKDKTIAEMAKMLEIAMKHKESQDINLLRIAEDSERLEDKFNKMTLCRNPQIHENEVLQETAAENTLDQFEMSSYLNPPNAQSLLICPPQIPQTETQACQTENPVPKSVGITCDISVLTPEMVQQKCQDLQLSSQTLRSEITSLKSYVSSCFNSVSGSNSEEILRVIDLVFNKQNADLVSLKAAYSKDIDYQNNIQIQLKEELDILKFQCEKTLEAKDEEIHALTEEIKQLKEKDKEYKLQQENEIQTVQLTNEGIIKNKNDEIRTLIAKNSRLDETLKDFNLDKKREIDQIKFRTEENLRSKNEELRSLRLKVSQLEDAKRNEHKLNTLSSRLSPEGSELEADVSLADSTSGAESHYRLTRTKIDYLKLTPPVECIDDGEILEQSSSSDIPNSIVEDLKLQLLDMEKKYDANRKYLDEQTIEREQERDEYHRTIEDYRLKNEDFRKEIDKLSSSVTNQKHEIGDYEMRLKDAVETEQDLIKKCERFEDELKSAVDKIFELREIIRDLEEQIDSATVNALDLKDQNQMLSEELDRLEGVKREQDDAMNTTQDTVNTLGGDMIEELQTQLGDITRRLEKKLNEMDNFPWQTRPNSSCSGAISVSTEDVSVREFSYINRDKECDPRDAGPLLCDGLRRLDTHFENFVRFQEIIVKKLQDADLRVSFSKKRIEELENEKAVYQENAKSQINVIADLESRLDQFRFEPSPSAVTLSGLRARVSSLSEECDQYKGNLELRTYELQDAIKRHAATQAMFEQYKKMAAQNAASQASKNSVQIQTQSQTSRNNSFTQTEKEVTITKVSTKEACVQTNEFCQNPEKEKYKYFNHQSFELSTIPGGPAPTFSTPNNEVVNLQKSSIKNNNLANAWSFLDHGHGDSELLNRTPEIVRNRGQPSLSVLSGEKSVERFSNKSVSFNIQALDQDRGDRDRAPGQEDFEQEDSEDSLELFDNDKPGKRSLDKERNAGTSKNGPNAGESRLSSSGQPKNGAELSSTSGISDNGLQSEKQKNAVSGQQRGADESDPFSNSGKSGQPRNSVSSASNGGVDKESSRDFIGTIGSPRKMSKKFVRRDGSLQPDDETSLSRKNSKGQSDENKYDSEGRRISKSHPEGYAYDGKVKKGSKNQDGQNPSQNLPDGASSWTFPKSQDDDGESRLEEQYSNYEDDIHSDSSVDERRKNSKLRRSLQSDTIDSSDDERMLEEGRRKFSPLAEERNRGSSGPDSNISSATYDVDNAKGGGQTTPKDLDYLTKGSKDEQIEKMLNKIKDLEDILNGPNDDFLLETKIKFDKDGVPITAKSTVRNGLGDGEDYVNPQEIQRLLDKIEREGLESLSDAEVNKLMKALKAKASPPKVSLESPITKTGESDSAENFSFSVAADTTFVTTSQGIIDMETRLSSECPDELSRQMPGDNAAQRGRIADTDKQIALEAMKTQLDQLQQALNQERARSQDLAGILSQATGQPASSFIGGPNGQQPQFQSSRNMNPNRNGSIPNLEAQVAALNRQLSEQIRNEAQLAADYGTAMGVLRDKQLELNQIRLEKDDEIELLKAQLICAADQIHRKSTSLNESRLGMSMNESQFPNANEGRMLNSPAPRPTNSSLNYLELYLKARSFRKALIWQKKYLLLTIQGYKDILRASGIQYDPDLLQKEIVIAPSSVGLADRRRPITRFKIVAKAIVALTRMKYMVSRWKSKSVKTTMPSSAEESPVGPSSRIASRNESKNVLTTTPPTKEPKLATRSSAGTSITNIPLRRETEIRRSSVNPRFPGATVNPIEFSNAPSTSTVPRATASGTTVLSQYLDRFEYLENQLGSSLGREASRPPDHEHDE